MKEARPSAADPDNKQPLPDDAEGPRGDWEEADWNECETPQD